MSFNAFEHKLLKVFKEKSTGFDKVWVSCSYGSDSLVLLNALVNINPILKLDIKVIHIHHGLTDDLKILSFRDEALTAIQNYCENKKLELKIFKSNKKLKSESDYREFRLECYKELHGSNILLGHHKQDLTETLLLKLIRGVGPQGFHFGDLISDSGEFNLFRPLLSFTKNEILEEMESKNLKPVEDPSNESSDFLRNWIRNDWLKSLEDHRPGSLKSLGESLGHLSNAISSDSKVGFDKEKGILINDWLSFSDKKKKELVAQILNSESVKSFTSGQISEVIKQLDLLKKEHIFNLAGLMWSKDSKRITFKKNKQD